MVKNAIVALLMFQAQLQLLLLFTLVLTAYATEQPHIRSVAISGTNLSIRVTTPAGAQKLTLEGKPQVSRRTWEPRAVRRDLEEGEQLITIPLTREMELLRVKAENTGVLPPEFFTGKSEFEESSRVADGGATGGTTGSGMTGGWTGGTTAGGTTAGPTGATTGGTGGAAVLEADVWQIQGQKLYFFNQHRGLHKFDISDLGLPRLESTYEMNDSGDQMFSLGDDIVLMFLSGCGWERRLTAFDMKSQPRILWEFPLPGTMYEARLIGSDFIFAAPIHRESGTPGLLEYGTSVLCLDLSDPSTNRVKTTVFLPLWASVSKATDRNLFLSGERPRGWSSEPSSIQLHINGSSVPDRPTADWLFLQLDRNTSRYSIQNADDSVWFLSEPGRFEWDDLTLKLRSDTGFTNELRFFHDSGYRFTATFTSMDGTTGSYFGGFMSGTAVEWESILTFVSMESLRDGQPQPIELTLAGWPRTKSNFHDENGILTVLSEGWRPDPFGGGRNWRSVETFSLADPVKPGRLGFTNFADNEELFSIQFDGNKAYVMTTRTNDGVWLLDLSRPQDPVAAGRLSLPGRTLFVQPLPGQKLLTIGLGEAVGRGVRASLFDLSDLHTPALLDSKIFESEDPAPWAIRNDKPFAAYLPEAGMALVPLWGEETLRAVQLVQVTETNLTLRGKIDRSVEPRGITPFGDRLLSVASLEVLSVDITNRHQPRVQASVDLMRRIDELFEFGPNFVEIDYGDNLRPPEVRLAHDGMVTQRLVLSNGPVVRFERRGDLLFFAQSRIANPQTQSGEATHTLRFSIVELSSPLRLRGQTEFTGQVVTWQNTHDLLWPSDRTLVWCVNRPRPVPETPSDTGGALGSGGSWDGVGGVGAIATPPHGGLLGAPSWFVLDVSDPSAPKFVSRAGIDPRDKTNFSETFAAPDFLYVSWLNQKIAVRPDMALEVKEKTELAVIDLSTPSEPVVRTPITIPANLVGLAHNGSLFYTAGFDFLTNGARSTNIFLTLLAYDDVAVHLVDRAMLSHFSSEFIKERDGSLYFLENRPVESALMKFSVGRIPILRQEAVLPLRANGLSRLWNFGDDLAFGNEREIRIISLRDRKVSPALDISAVVRCRWWFRAEHLVPTSAGYLMPLGYFNPQLIPWASP